MGHGEKTVADLQADLTLFSKLRWMLEKQDHSSWLVKLFAGKRVEKEERVELPSFADFHDNALSTNEKLNFVLLALEKVYHVHPAAIEERDWRYLYPSNTGFLLKCYFVALQLPLGYGVVRAAASRSLGPRTVLGLAGYLLLLKSVLEPAPLVAKEWVRRARNRRVALKYFERQRGSLELFKRILDPRTDPHELHHLSL